MQGEELCQKALFDEEDARNRGRAQDGGGRAQSGGEAFTGTAEAHAD